jgi:3'-5' exoribonuclease
MRSGKLSTSFWVRNSMPTKSKSAPPKNIDELDALFSDSRGGKSREAKTEIVALHALCDGQEADFFALLAEKQEKETKHGKPFFRVTFRDTHRKVGFPIWSDSQWGDACRSEWIVGQYYKLRAVLRQSDYGPQLEIKRIRPVDDADLKDGFDPLMCQPVSRFDAVEMFAELMNTIESRITNEPLRRLVADILEQNREQMLKWPAAKRNHHAFVSGYLEHVLNVTRTTCQLADRYCELYSDLEPPICRDVAIAGAVLHDVGKLRELATTPAGADYTAAGCLIGHVLQGRDIVREAAAGRDIDPELMLRLEHVIVAHQRLPEWGAPKPPLTAEALIVHYADDLDAKMNMLVASLKEDATDGPLTSKQNSMGQQFYRGGV